MLLLRRIPAGVWPVVVVLSLVSWCELAPNASSPHAVGAGLLESPEGTPWKASTNDLVDLKSLVVERHPNGMRSAELKGYTSMTVVRVDEDGNIHETCVSSPEELHAHVHDDGESDQ